MHIIWRVPEPVVVQSTIDFVNIMVLTWGKLTTMTDENGQILCIEESNFPITSYPRQEEYELMDGLFQLCGTM